MPFVRIADTAKIELVAFENVSLQPIVNVLHARLADVAQTSGAIAAMATAVEAWWHGARVDLADNTTQNYVRVTGLSTATAPQSTVISESPNVGTDGAGTVPGVAALIKGLTEIRGRSFRGRMFWATIPAANVLLGGTELDPGYVTALNGHMVALDTALGALDPTSFTVIASRKLGTSQGPVVWNTEVAPAFQRRRSQR